MNRASMVLALLVVLGLFAFLWPRATASAEEHALVVEGKVVNATQGGGSVEGLTAVLHQESREGHRDIETVTGAEGRFRFEDVVYSPDVFYGVSVRYQGALYGQDIDLSSGAASPVTLTVYEATDREEVLSVTAASVLFSDVDKAGQTLNVLEIVTIGNNSSRTYVPGPEPMKLLRFSLPPGSTSLQVDTGLLGADVLQVDSGFALTASVPPGEHEVMYAYQAPYSETEVSFAKSLPYGAGRLRVLAPQGTVEVSSSQLEVSEMVDIGGRPYQLLQGNDLPRASKVGITLQGLPQSSLVDRLGRRVGNLRLEYAAPGGLVVLVVLVLGFALWRRGTKSSPAINLSTRTAIESDRQVLLQRLADLKDKIESGNLSQEEYQLQHNALMGRLAVILRGEVSVSDPQTSGATRSPIDSRTSGQAL